MKIESYNFNHLKGINTLNKNFKKENLYENISEKKEQDYSFCNYIIPNAISRARLINERVKLLKPLSEEEYAEIIKKITSDEYEKNPPFAYIGKYKDVDSDFIGLVPYCGEEDIHDEINCWLTARKCKNSAVAPDEKMANIVRALDYSLKKLDDRFGKFEGVVYRSGFFNPVTDKEYYSSSSSSLGAIDFGMCAPPSPKKQYSIIKLKNGHKISDFQRYANNKYSNKFAETEKEILIDRTSKFRLIPEEEYTEKDKRLKEEFLALVMSDTNEVTQRDIDFALEEYGDRLDYISIWEEI